MDNSITHINNIIDFNYDKLENIKRVYGVVMEIIPLVDENGNELPYTHSAKIKVKIRDTDSLEDYISDEDSEYEKTLKRKKWLTILNKTGEPLKVGDAVWVHYWKTISDGYAAIKIGESEERYAVTAQTAMTVTDDEDIIEALSDGEENIHNFIIQNITESTCGGELPMIYVGGCPALYYPRLRELPTKISYTSSGDKDFKQWVLGLDESLFVKHLKVNTSTFITSGNRAKEIEFKYDTCELRQLDSWVVRPAIYKRMVDINGNLTDWSVHDMEGNYTSSDSELNQVVSFKSHSDMANAGFIIVFDEIYFHDSLQNAYPKSTDSSQRRNPYGCVHGTLIARSFDSKGFVYNTANGVDLFFGSNPYTHSAGLSYNYDNYIYRNNAWGAIDPIDFGFTSKAEQDYAMRLFGINQVKPY